ncbi:MAG: DUF6049 family protein [Actinomycetota bacterium]
MIKRVGSRGLEHWSPIKRAGVFAMIALIGILFVSESVAQTTPPQSSVSVSILSFSPYTDPSTPLHVEVLVHNMGQLPIDNGSVHLQIYPRVGSRSELAQNLDGNPQRDILLEAPNDFSAPLEPNDDTTIKFDLNLPALANTFRASAQRDGVYPVGIHVRESDRDLWVGWTAMVFLTSKPATKLNVSWILPVHTPTMLDDEGVDGGIAGHPLVPAYRGERVARAVGPSGSLLSLSESFQKLAALGVTFAPTPMLLDELNDIAKGFRQHDPTRSIDVAPKDATPRGASAVLDRLRRAVALRTVEIASVPYSRADLIDLLHDSLPGDVTNQLALGNHQIAADLGRGPNKKILVPGNLQLDDGSISAVVASGVRTAVLRENSLPPQPGLYGAQRPVIVQGADGAQLTALLSDDKIQQRLETDTSPTPDPVLRAQAVLADIASTWLELPNDASRGVVIATSITPDVATVKTLADGLSKAPWVKMRSISGFIASVPADQTPQRVSEQAVPAPLTLQEVGKAKGAVGVLSLVISSPQNATEPLDRLILGAESADWEVGTHGYSLAHAALVQANRIVSAISVSAGRQVTLTSRTGTLPVTILNGTSFKVRVMVRLISAKVSFIGHAPRQNPQTRELDNTPVTLEFTALARTAGAFPVTVQLLTPDGQFRFGGNDIIVRSTVVSLVALLAMGTGAIIMLAAWIRRGGHRKGGKRARTVPDGTPATA